MTKQKVPRAALTAAGVGAAFLHEGSASPVATDTGVMACPGNRAHECAA